MVVMEHLACLTNGIRPWEESTADRADARHWPSADTLGRHATHHVRTLRYDTRGVKICRIAIRFTKPGSNGSGCSAAGRKRTENDLVSLRSKHPIPIRRRDCRHPVHRDDQVPRRWHYGYGHQRCRTQIIAWTLAQLLRQHPRPESVTAAADFAPSGVPPSSWRSVTMG
jgi:hypothetical protein